MKTVWDVETTWSVLENNKTSPSPFLPTNKLVSVGAYDGETSWYWCMDHSEREPDANARVEIQRLLDATTVFVAHNAKFDLLWLRSCEFGYTGVLYDTMIFEYVLSAARRWPLDLNSCCKRHSIPGKLDLFKKYMSSGVNTDQIPWEGLKEYGIQDLISCWELSCKQDEMEV
jgi:DNA polymerase I-like protein with 3'-5' exonuclease and polymerase domains